MSDFNKIIEYLRYTRQDEEREAKTTHRPAIIITEDFDLNAPFHEEDYIYVDKEKIRNHDGYYTLQHLYNAYYSRLYLRTISNDEIEYYIRKPIEIDGEDHYQYKKLPYGDWHVNNPLSFTEVKVGYTFYYSSELEKCIYLPLKEVVVLPEQITYHPKDLKNNPSGEYSFQFKDAEGYSGEKLETVWAELDPTGYSRAYNNISLAKRKVEFIKNQKPGLMHLFPKIDLNCRQTKIRYNYYEKVVPNNSFLGDPVLELKFNHFGAQLLFLNATIFYYFNELDDFDVTRERQTFFDDYTSFVDDLLNTRNNNKILEVLYYVPTFHFKKLDKDFLWTVLDKVLEGSINNIGLDTEDIVLHLLKGLLETSSSPDAFLLKLIKERENKETRFSILYKGMDGENFVSLIWFLYDTWAKSTFTDLDNTLFKASDGPLPIPYKSEKFIGFYSSNKNFDFISNNNIYVTEDETWVDNVISVFDPGAGKAINQLVEEQNNYTYHYFHPLMLVDVEQESAIPIPKYIPAFFLKANEDKSFWSNVVTGIEYGVDIITTLSGVGNIAKFRHLSKIAKVASRFNKFDKARKYASVVSKIRLASGAIEISSGTVNALIKLADLKKSPFWKELSTFLFWLEMLSLGGELTAAIKSGLRKSADDLLKYEDELVERATREGVEDVDGLIDDLDLLAKPAKLGNFGGKVLKASQVRKLKGTLKQKGITLFLEDDLKLTKLGKVKNKQLTKLFNPVMLKTNKFDNVVDLFFAMRKNNVAGAFDAKGKQFFLSEKPTEYLVFHEMAHVKHFEELGDAYHGLKAWEKETYVFEEIWSQKRKWTNKELNHALNYVNKVRYEAGQPLINKKI
ncbi:zincin-like metallopeptidase toxin domain-containing protein [uncultured Psychroserpens sp.]|uniref:zincin-like metallopeptidase toxin domain-containing protein n=1 Tax=uncultured Psychroserpens sp. TaxID=255436 RepID=UPI00262C2880|nr:zincin-like metallopeptidase toxin domain-containing protein [uncultured Psychroserpens sp.]